MCVCVCVATLVNVPWAQFRLVSMLPETESPEAADGDCSPCTHKRTQAFLARARTRSPNVSCLFDPIAPPVSPLLTAGIWSTSGGSSPFPLLAYKEHKFHPVLSYWQASGTVGATASSLTGKAERGEKKDNLIWLDGGGEKKGCMGDDERQSPCANASLNLQMSAKCVYDVQSKFQTGLVCEAKLLITLGTVGAQEQLQPTLTIASQTCTTITA